MDPNKELDFLQQAMPGNANPEADPADEEKKEVLRDSTSEPITPPKFETPPPVDKTKTVSFPDTTDYGRWAVQNETKAKDLSLSEFLQAVSPKTQDLILQQGFKDFGKLIATPATDLLHPRGFLDINQLTELNEALKKYDRELLGFENARRLNHGLPLESSGTNARAETASDREARQKQATHVRSLPGGA